MNDFVASQVIDAYKSNPLLTGLLILNIGMFIGFGWHLNKRNEYFAESNREYLERIDRLQSDLLGLAKTCVVPE